jgi:hypothetical protein
MRRSTRVAIVISIMFGLGGLPIAANAAPMRYSCDTADGSVSGLVQQQDGPNYALQAEIRAMRFGRHREVRPSARIQIRSADGNKAVWVQLSASAARPPALAISLFTDNGSEEKQYMVTTVRLGEAARVSMRTKAGALQAEVAGQVADIPIQIGPHAEISVTCSTGEFIFEKLSMEAAN